MQSVRKIGILRANALGDFIVTLPAIAAIRNFYPHAEIVLLGNEWHKDFLEETDEGKRRTPVDRVMVVPVIDGIRAGKIKSSEKEINEFFSKAQQENFDLLFSFQGKGIASIPFLKRIGAHNIYGLACNESDKPDDYVNYYYYQPEVLRFIEVVNLAGIPLTTVSPGVTLLDKDIKEATQFLSENFVKEKFITLHSCGTDIRRMWTVEKFAELSNVVAQQGFTVVFTGSAQDVHYVNDILSLSGAESINSCGRLSLGGLAALYHLSCATVSIDTGTLHLAIASGGKTIGLYWGPNVVNWAPLTRKNHRPVVSWKTTCPQCGIIPNDPYPFEPAHANCTHNFSFIDTIEVTHVVNEIQHLIR